MRARARKTRACNFTLIRLNPAVAAKWRSAAGPVKPAQKTDVTESIVTVMMMVIVVIMIMLIITGPPQRCGDCAAKRK